MIIARHREAKAWELACAGKTQAEIAEELQLTQPSVSRALRRAYARVTAECAGRMLDYKALQHGRLEHVLREALDGWERSKEPRKRSRRHVVRGKRQEHVDEAITDEASTSDGNPAFLETAISAAAEINRLWGLVTPKRLELIPAGRPLEGLTDAELLQRAREGADALRASESGAGVTLSLSSHEEGTK